VGTHYLGSGSFYFANGAFNHVFNASSTATITQFSDANTSVSGTFTMTVRSTGVTNVITSGSYHAGDMYIAPF
jgi:hypothetical protein